MYFYEKVFSSITVTVLLIVKYLYFFIGLYSLTEYFYFGKSFHFVDLSVDSDWLVTFI